VRRALGRFTFGRSGTRRIFSGLGTAQRQTSHFDSGGAPQGDQTSRPLCAGVGGDEGAGPHGTENVKSFLRDPLGATCIISLEPSSGGLYR
jgi:hypothetical protein